ncbi:MAG: HPr family phosphocarrier protein [Deltaproteobacteria bacterium]|nr:HPr family phosphocarrier protein [Deltaproteobacteria bacterium]
MHGKHQESEPYEVEWEIWVENRLGIHARPAAQIMNLAAQFDATLILEKDGLQANTRELLALLALDCPQGTRLVIKASGAEAWQAAQALAGLFARKFGET